MKNLNYQTDYESKKFNDVILENTIKNHIKVNQKRTNDLKDMVKLIHNLNRISRL